jgi:phosphoribosylformylglycinamidine synthase
MDGQNAELDFASVQRDNAEMERRAQEVIQACTALGDQNPIVSIHDVGAGGLSNAFPELVHDSHLGAQLDLRAILSDEPSMSPREIWSNESQERYVLAVSDVALLQRISARERCPMAVVGVATSEEQLSVKEGVNTPINVPLSWLFGNTPEVHKTAEHVPHSFPLLKHTRSLKDSALAVLRHPTVADKTFLITIGDRSVTGLVTRDSMVGPYQIPVSDVAVVASSYWNDTGEAMAMGERSPLALINPAASSRMAVGEAITNIVAARISQLSDIKLSANWMAACGEAGQDAALFDAVEAIGMHLCPALGIAIPVGKDSLSMRVSLEQKTTFSPISCIISAFASVKTLEKTLTPELQAESDTVLWLLDLGEGKQRLGGSSYAQTLQQMGTEAPDVENPLRLKHFFDAIQALQDKQLLLAYHDKSDGGLWATLCEMSFASHLGFDITLSDNVNTALFNEELGAVIQIKRSDEENDLFR